MVDKKEGGGPDSSGGQDRQEENSRSMESVEILRELKEILELLKRGILGDGDE
jgi:hypothetical protein